MHLNKPFVHKILFEIKKEKKNGLILPLIPFIYTFVSELDEQCMSITELNRLNVIFSFTLAMYNDLEVIAEQAYVEEHELWNNLHFECNYKNNFNDYLKLNYECDSFYQKYSVLKELIEQRIYDFILFIKNTLNQYVNDFNFIKNLFNLTNRYIDNIIVVNSDSHNRCKRILIFIINNIKIVYKSKSVYTDKLLNSIYFFLNQNNIIKTKFNIMKIWGDSEHGWHEFINHEKQNVQEDIKNIYYNAGMHIAIFLILSSTDMHFENIIAKTGEFKVIDTETLMGAHEFSSKSLDGLVNNELTSNIFKSSFINNSCITHNKFIDVSVLTGPCFDNNDNFKRRKFKFENRQLILEEMNYQILNPTNEVFYQDKKINPYNFINNIKTGYFDVFKVIQQNLTSFLAILSEYQFNLNFRVLIRPTIFYQNLKYNSYHPILLLKQESRKNFLLENLKKSNIDPEVINLELAQLLKSDIPYFHLKYDQKNFLRLNHEYTIKETFEDKINSLDKNLAKRNWQTFIMGLHCIEVEIPIYRVRITKDIISKISNLLKINSIHKTIILPSLKRDGLSLSKININLFEGLGTYIFIKELLGNEKNYWFKNEHIDEIDKDFEEQIKKIDYDNLSMFHGIGSVLYYYLYKYKLTNNSKYLKLGNNILEKIGEIVKSKKNLESDFFNGKSGLFIFLFNNEFFYKKSLLGEVMLELFNSVINEKNDFNSNSLAFGNLSYAWIYSIMYAKTSCCKYRELSDEIISKTYHDLLSKDDLSWSTGISGLLICLKNIYLIKQNNNENVEYIKVYFKNILDYLLNINIDKVEISLMNGIGGIISVLYGLKDIIHTNLKLLLNDVLMKFEKKFEKSIVYLYDLNFLQGSVGIAYLVNNPINCSRLLELNLPI